MNWKLALAAGAAAAFVAGCVTSPKASIENDLVTWLGIPKTNAKCIADEYGRRLDDKDMKAMADFISRQADSTSVGNSIDAFGALKNSPATLPTTLAVAAACSVAPKE